MNVFIPYHIIGKLIIVLSTYMIKFLEITKPCMYQTLLNQTKERIPENKSYIIKIRCKTFKNKRNPGEKERIIIFKELWWCLRLLEILCYYSHLGIVSISPSVEYRSLINLPLIDQESRGPRCSSIHQGGCPLLFSALENQATSRSHNDTLYRLLHRWTLDYVGTQ